MFRPLSPREQLAERAFKLAQRNQAAIVLSDHGPIVVSTNTRDFDRIKQPEKIIGVYDAAVPYPWILADLEGVI